MGQVRDLIKLFGIRKLLGMNSAEKAARGYFRGYSAFVCFTVLLNAGFIDRMRENKWVNVEKYARDNGFDPHVLDSILEYLDGISLVRLDEGFCRLTAKGKKLSGMPRGGFSLLWGYTPVFNRLEEMLHQKIKYGVDVFRLGEYVAKGSGELSRHLPFPVMSTLIVGRGLKRILDLGSGDLEFLFALCADDPEMRCHGIDISPEAVEYARTRLAASPFADRITTDVGDMFNIREIAPEHPEVDTVTAIDTFHEYLRRGHDVVVDLMRSICEAYPNAYLVIGEFCKQTRESLRRRPTGFLEHHLFHDLTDQEILFADQWEELFKQAELVLEEKKVFSLVGHGYFVLRRPGHTAGSHGGK